MSANELIAIELQLKGYEGVMSDFRALDQMLNGFRGSKNKVAIQVELDKSKREVIALDSEVKKLKNDLANTQKYIKGTKIPTEEWANLNKKLQETQQKLTETRTKVRELQTALRQFSQMSFTQTFNKISSAVAHLGSAMQSAGNALTRLTNPFANFTKGIVMGAGYQALGKFTEGLTSAFDRADVMRKYPRVMQAMGYSAEEAEASISKLDQAVQGLPTKLDDIVSMSQRFTSTLGDMNRGTDLAIAANNAFLASMSTESQRYQGMMQLQDVIGGKKLNSREWYSLANSMMPAIRMMGESLGYTGKELDEYVGKVQQGKIANEEFLDTLVKAGTDENGKIRTIAMEALDTWEAFFSRIGTAASRLGYKGIIEPLNEIVNTVTGGKFKSVNLLLDDFVVGGIDKMTAGIRDWVKAHPEEITEFFKSLKSIDFASIARGFGEAMLELGRGIKAFADFAGGKDLSWIGKFMVKGNILGNALTIFGGLLKGSRHLLGGIGAGGVSIFKMFRGAKKEGGLFKYLAKSLVGDAPKATEEAIETATREAPKMGKFMTGLSKVFKGWGTIATMVGGTAVVGFVSFKAFKSMLSDLKEMTEIAKGIDWKAGSAVLGGMTTFFGGFIGLSKLLGNMKGKLKLLEGGAILGGLSLIFSGAFWADMKLIKGGFKSIRDATELLGEALDNLKGLTQIDDVPQIKKNVQQAIAVFNSITDLLQISRNTPAMGEGTNGLKELDKKSANTIKNVADAVKNMKTATDTLNELSATKMQLGGLSTVMAGLRNAFTQLGNLLVDMPSVFKDGTASGWAEKMSGTMTNFKSVFTSLVGKGGILSSLPKLVKEMAELTKGNVFTDLPGRMEQLGQVLTNVYTSLQGIGAGEYFASNIDNFRNGLKSLKFAIKHLQEIGGMEIDTSLVTKIQDIIQNIQKAFDQGQITTLSNTIKTFKQSIEDALKSFEELNGDIDIDVKVKLNKGFDSSVKSASKKIRGAKGNIQDALDSVPSSFTKRITVKLIVNTVTSGMGAVRQAALDAYKNAKASMPASTGGRASRNGLLYRSGGGSVFKPRGTDKIPAMLTEGEYVHKKQAVDYFGTDFMRSVNNLDVRGAMKALLTKAGSATNIGRQSIVNNTVNNNQRVNMTVNTNNPNFAGARMGRFVGAL